MHNTHLFKTDCAESSRQVHKREADQCFLIIINNPLYTWYQIKKVFLFTFHQINIWLIDSTKKPPTHFMIKENKAKKPQIIKEGTCKSLPELLTVLGRGRNSGRNSESGHWWWVWSITLTAGDQSTRVTMRIRNDGRGQIQDLVNCASERGLLSGDVRHAFVLFVPCQKEYMTRSPSSASPSRVDFYASINSS